MDTLTARRPAYRPDIDGLRALAVLLVLFNHVGIQKFSGGFVGVDVFFVISGYLIGAHILEEIRGGRFSIARFYERRFRRIMPALLATLLATSAFAYIFLFPSELKSFADTELGALFSVSNIVILHQTSYFDPIGKLKPLLHTWSLGVEEQFYIVFPLLLFVIMRWGRRHLKLILWALTLGLFALAKYWTRLHTNEAFFLAPYRAWELLCGGLLAAEALPRLQWSWSRNVASAVGFFLILRCGLVYQETTLFPGVNALDPCLGAVLIIAAGESGPSLVGQALSWKPIRWIGLISYSLYLWHWPIQVFQTTNRILVPDRSPLWESQAAVILISILVAALSWRFIEQPFRTGHLRAARPLFAINGGLFALVAAFSWFVVFHHGWPPPWAPKFEATRDAELVAGTDPQMRWSVCYVDPTEIASKFNASKCLAEDPSRKQYLVVGDSHSAHGFWGLRTAFPQINFSQFSVTGCIPLLSQVAWTKEMCGAAGQYLYDDYLLHHRVDTVIFFARWHRWDLDQIKPTVDWLKERGMKTVIIGPSIEFDAPLPRLLELSRHEHDPALPDRHSDPAPQELDRQMKILARDEWHVPYISIYDNLCTQQALSSPRDASRCAVYGLQGVPMLWDTDHFSPLGAVYFGQTIQARHELP